MALRFYLGYRSPDSTQQINEQHRYVEKGIFEGGAVTYNGTTLTIAPFKLMSFDGMVIASDANITFTPTLTASAYEIIFHAEYRLRSTPEGEFLSASGNSGVVADGYYNNYANKNILIRFARLVKSGATYIVEYNSIPTAFPRFYRDDISKLSRFQRQSSVNTFADLPSFQEGARDSDIRTTLDSMRDYIFRESTNLWEQLSPTSDVESVLARTAELTANFLRKSEGSGILAGLPYNHSLVAPYNRTFGLSISEPTTLWEGSIPIYTLLGTPNTLALGNFTAIINGHIIGVRYYPVSIGAQVANQLDLIYLEVWRELLTVSPDSYATDSFPAGTIDFNDLKEMYEEITYTEGQTGGLSDTWIVSIEYNTDHTLIVTKAELKVTKNVGQFTIGGNLSPLNAPMDTTGYTTIPLNKDSNPFALAANVVAPNTPAMERCWVANYTTSVDGVSWGIPLLLIRGDIASTNIEIFKNAERYIFEVAPLADTSFLQKIDTTLSKNLPEKSDYPSGVLSGIDSQFLEGTVTNSVIVPEQRIVISNNVIDMDSHNTVILPAPSNVNSTHRFDVIIAVLYEIRYIDDTDYKLVGYSQIKNAIDNMVAYPTLKVCRYECFSVTSSSWTMFSELALKMGGWSRVDGDPGLYYRDKDIAPLVTHYYTNGGVLTTLQTPDSRYLVSDPICIPIAVISRRNTQPYTLSNQEGGDSTLVVYPSGGRRPDLCKADIIVPMYDVLDARHLVSLSEHDAKSILSTSMELLKNGLLHTCFGKNQDNMEQTIIDVVDAVAPLPGPAGTNVIGSGDGIRMLWSDAHEAYIFPINIPHINVIYALGTDISWDPNAGGAGNGELIITAPDSCYFPGYVNLNAPPLGIMHPIIHFDGSTRDATGITPATRALGNPPDILAVDTAGHPIQIKIYITWDSATPDSDNLNLSVAVRYTRRSCHTRVTVADPHYTSTAVNGLTKVPDYAYQATFNGNPCGVDQIACMVSKIIPAGGSNQIIIEPGDIATETGYNIGAPDIDLLHAEVVWIGDGTTPTEPDFTYFVASQYLVVDGSDHGTQIVINFSALLPEDTRILVYVFWRGFNVGALNKWTLLNRGSKALLGIFQYNVLNMTSIPVAGNPTLLIPDNPAWWTVEDDRAGVVPPMGYGIMPQSGFLADYHRFVATDDFSLCNVYGANRYYENLVTENFTMNRSHLETNGSRGIIYTFKSPITVGIPVNYSNRRLVVVTQRPVQSTDTLIVWYKSTPYQGLSALNSSDNKILLSSARGQTLDEEAEISLIGTGSQVVASYPNVMCDKIGYITSPVRYGIYNSAKKFSYLCDLHMRGAARGIDTSSFVSLTSLFGGISNSSLMQVRQCEPNFGHSSFAKGLQVSDINHIYFAGIPYVVDNSYDLLGAIGDRLPWQIANSPSPFYTPLSTDYFWLFNVAAGDICNTTSAGNIIISPLYQTTRGELFSLLDYSNNATFNRTAIALPAPAQSISHYVSDAQISRQPVPLTKLIGSYTTNNVGATQTELDARFRASIRGFECSELINDILMNGTSHICKIPISGISPMGLSRAIVSPQFRGYSNTNISAESFYAPQISYSATVHPEGIIPYTAYSGGLVIPNYDNLLFGPAGLEDAHFAGKVMLHITNYPQSEQMYNFGTTLGALGWNHDVMVPIYRPILRPKLALRG